MANYATFVWYLIEENQFLLSDGIGSYMQDGYRMLPINADHNEYRIIRTSRLTFIGAL